MFLRRVIPARQGEGAGGGGADPAAASGADDGGGGAGGSDPAAAGGWMGGLDADVRAALSPKNYGSVNDLGRAYLTLEERIGQRGVTVPGENATDQERAEFFTALGRPEAADKYDLGDFKPPEGAPWDAEAQGQALGEFHKLGLTNDQAAGVIRWYGSFLGQQLEAQNTAKEQAFTAGKAALQKAFGTAYDTEIEGANSVIRNLGSPELVAEIERLGLDNSPHLTMLLAKVFDENYRETGKLAGGDGKPGFATTPEAARAEIKRLKADKEWVSAFMTRSHPEHQAAVEQMQRLQALAKPESAGAR